MTLECDLEQLNFTDCETCTSHLACIPFHGCQCNWPIQHKDKMLSMLSPESHKDEWMEKIPAFIKQLERHRYTEDILIAHRLCSGCQDYLSLILLFYQIEVHWTRAAWLWRHFEWLVGAHWLHRMSWSSLLWVGVSACRPKSGVCGHQCKPILVLIIDHPMWSHSLIWECNTFKPLLTYSISPTMSSMS